MWNDIIVGSGESFCSAITYYNSKNSNISISKNQSSYWITGCIFDKGMTIYKDCEIGKKLTKLLELPDDGDATRFPSKKSKDRQIIEFLNKLILKRLPYDSIISLIESIRKQAFEEGRQAKADEILNVLFNK